MKITDQEKQIITLIREEASRIKYGKLKSEMTVHKGRITNIQTERVRRSQNINYNSDN